MSRRATSKRLCFIASMPRSNRILSGCLESTFASGLLTFLLVQAVVNANMAASAIARLRKFMQTSKFSFLIAAIYSRTPPDASDFLQSGVQSSLQQIFSITLRIAVAEHSVARH